MQTVLIIVNHNITVYNFRKELVMRLKKEGCRVVIALPVIPETKKLTALGCEVIDVPMERRGTNPVHDLRLLRTYCRILKSVKPDVVLTYTIKPNVYGGLACRISKFPCIATITGLGVAIEGGGVLKQISLMLYRLGLKKVNAVFYQNTSNCQVFEKAGIAPKKGILVNGSGVNLQEYADIAYPLETAEVAFLFISRIMKSKGIEELLGAAEQIRRKYPRTAFHILGFCEDDYQERLEALTQKGIIQYHGMQQDIRPFMERAQCLIHPSYHEGMSNVCLEAAASCRAVIASNIKGCLETVEEGKTGYLCQAGSTESLTAAIEQYLSLTYEERKRMGEAGRQKMIREFDREQVVDRYMEQIRNAINTD